MRTNLVFLLTSDESDHTYINEPWLPMTLLLVLERFWLIDWLIDMETEHDTGAAAAFCFVLGVPNYSTKRFQL